MSTLTQPAIPQMSRRDLARYIDHTALKPEVTAAQIAQLCEEAQRYHFMAVCVNPVWVKRCVSLLSGSDTCVATVDPPNVSDRDRRAVMKRHFTCQTIL